MITKEQREELRRLAEKSTRVNRWYHHHQWSNEVRGPFGRWFTVLGGDNGMGDPVKYPTPVANVYEDAAFCAAAMNNIVALLDEIDRLEAANQDMRNLHKRCCL